MDRFDSYEVPIPTIAFTTGDENHREGHPIDGIEAIAARIHERAQQLSNEQDLLRHAERELLELREKVEQQKELNQAVHIQYLKSVTKTNSIEMECIQIKELIKDRISNTNIIKERENEIFANLSKKDAEWNITQGTLTSHKLRQELYLKVLQGVIDQREQAMSRQKFRMETTNRLSEEVKQTKESVARNQDRINDEMKCLSDMENDENRTIETLASQVRDALAKVRISHCMN
jgi:hypothetical protein